MRTRLLIGAVALLLYPFIAWSQVDEDTGDRENYVLNPSGQTLVVTQPNDDEASLVRRAPDGTDSTIVARSVISGWAATTPHGSAQREWIAGPN